MDTEQKAKKVIELYAEGFDAEQIAHELGYTNSKSLSRFMRQSGYTWDRDRKNYIKEEKKLKELDDFKDKIVEMLEWYQKQKDPKEIRIRRFTGPMVTKTFRMPPQSAEKLEKFCKENGYRYQDVILTALDDFIEKYIS